MELEGLEDKEILDIAEEVLKTGRPIVLCPDCNSRMKLATNKVYVEARKKGEGSLCAICLFIADYWASGG